ncbi:MAG: thioredoxin [Dehalococcoidia bacterium]|nr:MAG: thioredoxin [Dehalococcoidia bacterium]
MADHVIEITESEFQKAVKNGQGLIMVDFWAPWSGPCQMTGPVLEAVAEKMNDKVKIYKINIDDNHKLASELGVMSIPTMVIFKDGNELDRVVGALGESEITKRIEEHLA